MLKWGKCDWNVAHIAIQNEVPIIAPPFMSN